MCLLNGTTSVPSSRVHGHVYSVISKQNRVVIVVDLTCRPLIIAGTSEIPSHSLLMLRFIHRKGDLNLTHISKDKSHIGLVCCFERRQCGHHWASLYEIGLLGLYPLHLHVSQNSNGPSPLVKLF